METCHKKRNKKSFVRRFNQLHSEWESKAVLRTYKSSSAGHIPGADILVEGRGIIKHIELTQRKKQEVMR
jgi:hypothetical protein